MYILYNVYYVTRRCSPRKLSCLGGEDIRERTFALYTTIIQTNGSIWGNSGQFLYCHTVEHEMSISLAHLVLLLLPSVGSVWVSV